MNKTIFIHRRDLRNVDNTSLIAASKQSNEVIPIFIFTNTQIKSNAYKSDNAVKFMVESLLELKKAYNGALTFYEGDEFTIIRNLLKSNSDVNGIAYNKDYTKFSQQRDKKIEKIAQKFGVRVISEEDYALFPVGSITTGSNNVYKKFTPYYRRAVQLTPRKPDGYVPKNISREQLRGPKPFQKDPNVFHNSEIELIETPGRHSALKLLQSIRKGKWYEYGEKRDCLLYDTTHLSAYNKFGCVSIREVYEAILKSKNHNSLLRQLIWRDFFYNLSDRHPHIYDSKKNGLTNGPKRWVKNTAYLNNCKQLYF